MLAAPLTQGLPVTVPSGPVDGDQAATIGSANGAAGGDWTVPQTVAGAAPEVMSNRQMSMSAPVASTRLWATAEASPVRLLMMLLMPVRRRPVVSLTPTLPWMYMHVV